MANDGEVERFAVERNSRQALDDLFSATYAELRRLAAAARRRRARKRGDGAPPVVLEDVAEPASGDPEHLLALDAALHRLERLSVRQAAIVESRYFGGLETAETAELLNVSEATVLRDWRAARAWLARELRGIS